MKWFWIVSTFICPHPEATDVCHWQDMPWPIFNVRTECGKFIEDNYKGPVKCIHKPLSKIYNPFR